MLKAGRAARRAPGPVFYDNAFREPGPMYPTDWTKSAYIRLWNKIVETLRPREPRSILELGCGPGHFAALLHREFPTAEYYGIDFSPVAIERARLTTPSFTFGVEDLRTTKAFAREYDVVLATEVLEHVDDDCGLLAKLSPSFCAITVPTRDAEAHVRYFTDAGSVKARYASSFDALTVEADRSVKPKWWIGYGMIKRS